MRSKFKRKEKPTSEVKTEEIKNGYDETELIEVVSTFSQATGLQLGKELAKWIAVGSFMGASDAIPGYCGGTSMALLGVFKKLVMLTKSIFVPEVGITRMKAFLFMLPFGIGWILGVYGIDKGTEFLADKRNLGLELLFFFSTFVLFSIPMFIQGEKPEIGLKPKKRKHLWIRRTVFVMGFAMMIGLACWIKFGSAEKGIHFGDDSKKEVHLGIWTPTASHVFMLMAVAFIGGIFTITPGGSGAIIQLLFQGDEPGYRMYQTIHWKIMANFHGGHGSNFLGLMIFASFTMLGMITMIFLFAWLFKKHKRTFAAAAFGMMVASSISLLIIPHDNLWRNLSSSHTNYIGHRLGVAAAIVLAMICSLSLHFYTKHQNKQKINRKRGMEVIKAKSALWIWLKSLFTKKYWRFKIMRVYMKTKAFFTKEYWEEVRHHHAKNADEKRETIDNNSNDNDKIKAIKIDRGEQ
ncbi:undecaprenyl phosphate translocase family protein [Mycoplasma todarodis]|uniref:undecaprenyl phosphate translocase family protein n=1 Tax=Mycoplasma todarodis TaxID=1937191 RepID=UPI003B3637EE